MRLHALSASATVTRTLEAIILASGHELAPLADAQLLLIDAIHPAPLPATECPHWRLGGEATPDQPALALPFRPQQLKRLLAARGTGQPLTLGQGWSIDSLSRSLMHEDNSAIALTEKECALLKALQHAYPAALSRDALLAEVWGITHAIDTHTLETHIYRLRHKFEALSPPPCDIVTEGGSYRLTGMTA